MNRCLALTDTWALRESKKSMFALIKRFFKAKEKHWFLMKKCKTFKKEKNHVPYGNYAKRLNLLPNKTVGLCISQFPPFPTSVFLEAFCRVSCPDFCKNNSLSLLQEVLGNQIQLEHRMKLQAGFVPAAWHMPRADFSVQTFKEMNTEFYVFSYWMNYISCGFHTSVCF